MRNEAANNLILGLTSGLITSPGNYPEPPYLVAVEAAGAVLVAALRTPPYRLILSTTDYPAALDLVAADLQARAPDLPGVTGPVAVARAFAGAWQARTGATGTNVRDLRIYALRRVQPVSGVPGGLRRAARDDRDRVVDWFVAFANESHIDEDRDRIIRSIDIRLDNPHGGLWFWQVDGVPVSLVGASGLTPNGIRIGPVYTPPAHRRAGYASAATAAVSQLLLDGGREFVFLYTDLANATANHIYQAIGYEPVADTVDIEFASAPDPGG
jgi:predicted GNAT family acetyltransferase